MVEGTNYPRFNRDHSIPARSGSFISGNERPEDLHLGLLIPAYGFPELSGLCRNRPIRGKSRHLRGMRAPVHASTDGTPKGSVDLICDGTLYSIRFVRRACPILALLLSVRSAESASGDPVMPHSSKIVRSGVEGSVEMDDAEDPAADSTAELQMSDEQPETPAVATASRAHVMMGPPMIPVTDTPVTEVMTTPVLTVDGDETPASVASAMLENGIKSVVVIDDACHPVGILTSTDYVRMTADGVNPHNTRVREFMTRTIVTATTDETVPTVADRMRANAINHLPIVDNDETVVGIVSATDLTNYLATAD